MFQQFKKFSSTFNLKDLIDTTGIKEEDFKNITREGLQVVKNEWENFRSKSVEILTPGFSPRLNTLSLTTSNSSNKPRSPLQLNLSATIELATRYENEWNSIRDENKRNFQNATVNGLIQQIFETCKDHFETCEMIKSEANQLPKIKEMIEETTNSAKELIELEKIIDEYVKNNEVKSFEQWKQTQIIAFDQYVEEKKILYNQHLEEFMDNHKVQKAKIYQTNFEIQMDNYRNRKINDIQSFDEHNTIDVSDDVGEVLEKLEKLELETEEDRDALENFLESSSDTEDNITKS
ncbi:10536_t:CDS:2 [Diversispora eburnea]|uniref:10536_t:CDS:1 n=1 Tax=Diversispora eburnea TaxID=1213867 RepID=A0A9N8VZI2_9GLOM|nr:10536_t:CDS:2 [Diversispora eburnea]